MTESGANWLLMGIGLVLMVGPWIWYFALRKQGRQEERDPGKENQRK